MSTDRETELQGVVTAFTEEVDRSGALPFDLLARPHKLDTLAEIFRKHVLSLAKRVVCSYCGHETTFANDADWRDQGRYIGILIEHMVQCEKHPVRTMGLRLVEDEALIRLADFILLRATGVVEEADHALEVAAERDSATEQYRALRAGQTTSCLCPGCPTQVPVEWAAGVCKPCRTEDCEHLDEGAGAQA